MVDKAELVILTVALIVAVTMVLIIAMLYFASSYPNNAALYLSVLGGLSAIIVIIGLPVIVADVNKTYDISELGPGFLARWLLVVLSIDFAIASTLVLTTEKLENNPYSIWNRGEQN